MMVYKFRSFDLDSRIIAVERFFAATDAEAITMARAVLDRDQAVASFDLWEGERLIDGATPTRGWAKRPNEKAPSE